jgi:hypothetical protein
MATYEDEIEEVGEGVDHRDQEQGQQARDADLHPSTKIHPYRHGMDGIRGGETKSDPELKLTISSDRSAAAGWIDLPPPLVARSSSSRCGRGWNGMEVAADPDVRAWPLGWVGGWGGRPDLSWRLLSVAGPHHFGPTEKAH